MLQRCRALVDLLCRPWWGSFGPAPGLQKQRCVVTQAEPQNRHVKKSFKVLCKLCFYHCYYFCNTELLLSSCQNPCLCGFSSIFWLSSPYFFTYDCKNTHQLPEKLAKDKKVSELVYLCRIRQLVGTCCQTTCSGFNNWKDGGNTSTGVPCLNCTHTCRAAEQMGRAQKEAQNGLRSGKAAM